MLRLRPYKPCDAQSLVQWLTDEAGFWKWCAGRYDHYPVTADDINNFYDSFRMKDDFWQMGVFENNITAAHCYERLGFQKTGTCTDYHLMGEIWRFHDLTMMKTQWEERQ